jgi:hypothetical protein
MNKNDDILQSSDLGTGKRVSTPKKQVEKPDLNRHLQMAINWVDKNVLPPVFLVILAGLAVKGAQLFLPEMNEQTQLVVSIAAVSVLVVKIKARYTS